MKERASFTEMPTFINGSQFWNGGLASSYCRQTNIVPHYTCAVHISILANIILAKLPVDRTNGMHTMMPLTFVYITYS